MLNCKLKETIQLTTGLCWNREDTTPDSSDKIQNWKDFRQKIWTKKQHFMNVVSEIFKMIQQSNRVPKYQISLTVTNCSWH